MLNFLKKIFTEILLNDSFTKYIVAFQIPTVLCLCFQSIQAYKIGLPEFKRISIAWLANILYLTVNILFVSPQSNNYFLFVFVTVLDLYNMYLFLTATLPAVLINLSKSEKPFIDLKWLKRFPFSVKLIKRLATPKQIIFAFIIAGIARCIPGSGHIIPNIHLRYLPAATLNFLSLAVLAIYFKNVAANKYQGTALMTATLFYGAIQFLGIAQRDMLTAENKIYLDNIGFAFGLLAKIAILIFLGLFIVSGIQRIERDEKDKLLQKMTFAAKILKIKDTYISSKTIIEEEGDILRSVLKECLKLLNERLGYYAEYNEKSDELTVVYTSPLYINLRKFKFPATQGLTGLAVKTKEPQLVNSKIERSSYTSFGNMGLNSKIDKGVKSALAIPVILADHVAGVFFVESKKENYFTEIDENILKALVSQAEIAITNIRLVKELELGKIALESLQEIDLNITTQGNELDLSDILDFIIKRSLKMTRGESANICLINNNDQLDVIVSTKPENIGRTVDIHDSLVGKAYINKECVYMANLHQADEETKKLFKPYLDKETVSELAVPLIVQNTAIGVLNLESRMVDCFANDIENIKRFGGQTAIAIHIFRLLQDVRRARMHLQELITIEADTINMHKGLSATLDNILEATKRLNKQYAEILLFNKDGQLFVEKSTTEKDQNQLISRDSICGLAIEQRKTVYLPFIDKDDTLNEPIEPSVYLSTTSAERLKYNRLGRKDTRSELCIPLVAKNKVIGVFNVESTKYRDFPKEERFVLENLALAASIAIDNTRMLDEITVKNQALEKKIDYDRIEITKEFARLVNHRIGNSIGTIRVTLEDFMDGEYGDFSEEARAEFLKMLRAAETALGSGSEIRAKIPLMFDTPTSAISFAQLQQNIEQERQFKIYSDISIDIKGLKTLPPVHAHAPIIDEIVFELINNAIKAMNEHGTVIIRGFFDDTYVSISVTDSGCGIQPDNSEKIFNPLYSFWKNGQTGGGFGLFEIRQLIIIYGGDLKVVSSPSSGSTFTLTLPIKRHNTNL
ncbi:hypothetical protein A3860_36525 [Niastella vici]|uniref:histidine kinase n=1 Tax=Niastella vici TaxID=1703345 RepID=A0A1V9FMW6_9BACT|nr:GAF domain-containing protein [Niastella vici]OQP59678.1 hypothetical protein A3860_36525 [Niastella vici]